MQENEVQDNVQVETNEVIEAQGQEQEQVKEDSEVTEEVEQKEDKSAASEDDDAETLETKDEDSDDSDDDQEQKPKRRSGFKKRIDKLTSKITEKEKELEYWRSVALQKEEHAKKETKSEPEVVAQDAKPDLDNFDTYEDYLEALTDYKAKQIVKEHLSKQAEESKKSKEQQEYEKTISAHQNRINEFKAKVEDYDDVIEEVADVPVSLAFQNLIIESDNGPELIYELAKDRETLERLNSLPAMQLARELGRIEAKLSKPQKEEKKVTSAPAPIKPVGKKTSGVKKSIYDPNLSQAEFERLRAEQSNY